MNFRKPDIASAFYLRVVEIYLSLFSATNMQIIIYAVFAKSDVRRVHSRGKMRR